jgi:hypothetical protein
MTPEDCFLTVFHIENSYALLSGEAIPGAHTATNSAVSAYLARCLGVDDVGLDLQVKIDEASMPPGPRGSEPMIPRIFPLYPFI